MSHDVPEDGQHRVPAQVKICSICNKPFTEWGNRAWPVNDGTCCNACDVKYVTPARIQLMNRGDETK